MKEENGMIIDQLNIAMKGIDSQDSFRKENYSKQNEQMQRYINLENQKLKLQLGDLSKKIKEMQTDESVSALKEKLQKIEKQMSMVIEEYEQQMNSKDQQLKTITQKLIMTNGEVQKQNITLSRNEKKISEQAEIIEKLQEKTRQMQQLREILMMQREDFIQLEIKNVQKQQALFEVNKKCGRLEERLTKFEKKQEEGLVIPENPNFGDQKYFFQDLNKTISENETFSKYLRINFPDINYDIVEKKLNRIQNWIEDNKHDRKQDANSDNPGQKNFNINKFTVYRPTFFSFIEKQYNLIQKSQPQILRPTIIKPQFLQLMRSILDAKYNEFLQVQNYQCYSKFGDFVYSFLGNFKIDPITLKIVINKEIQGNSKLADDIRVNFYIDLMSPLLDQIWDVVIFREFLNEDSSNDELFFYLHVRNLIFKGPQMNHNCASFHPVHFIKWEHAEYSLVIRTLLEYFRSERHQKYKIIRDLFFNQQGQTIEGRFSINFEGFRNLFENENFLNTNELEKAYLYRQCYSLGRGVVSPEVFFAVITDSNFLTKHLIFKSDEDLPKFDNVIMFSKFEYQNEYQYQTEINLIGKIRILAK
ncbi:hypothetical protein PPERSA_01105 [Pseudocohnilembus persalinus]|uniref:Uncharacterized protein n=1 Tax=Pseudocohnilembus persalinus TaxID=266149 RepID=A0A0V0QUV4_PSEPJ|nr:hypothetical protein PPERSA_01105 [Pseudocohnilembus persalinus]|eukprot:KRX06027.1 hypothetical protein PPERSA_01105 [Pseudocohnilembus persalinus]